MKLAKVVIYSVIIMISGLIASPSFSATGSKKIEDTIEDRLAPVGKTCMRGEDCAAAPVVVADSGEKSGADIYSSRCQACHASGLAGAPKMGDSAAWAPRIDQGLETLYQHAIGGLNAMPAKGGCGNCSDDDIKKAVDHMIGASKS